MGSTKLLPCLGAERAQSAASPCTFLLLAGLTLLLRAPALFSHPFCIDESYYAAGAAELLSGGTFYKDVVDHKPPGIYLLYALIYRIAGLYNQWAVHVILIATVALTAYLLGRLAETLFGTRVGRWAGVLYVVASVVGPANDFQAANTELFMNLPLVAACWLCVRLWASGSISRSELFSVGVLVALAMLIRPQAAVVALPMAVVFWQRKLPLRRLGWIVLGGLWPACIVFAWLVRSHAWQETLTSLAYARTYANCLPFEVKLANATLKTLFFLAINIGLVIPAAAWLARARRDQLAWRTGAAAVLVAWLAASFVAVGAGGRFYPHYFIQVLPPLVILAARQLNQWQTEDA